MTFATRGHLKHPTVMSMSMIPLLVNSDSVPANARKALLDVVKAAPEERETRRKEAARILFFATDLQCSEVRDLMGLPHDGTC